ncbi:MAG: alpha/beta fold hydrolase [Anaerolineae bacterium]
MGKNNRHGVVFAITASLAASFTATWVRRSQEQRRALAHGVDDVTQQAVHSLPLPGESRFVALDTVRLHTVVAGPEDGRLAVLLHGFPECWYSWRHQIPVLARAGYRLAVPDQRGYNLSDKPAGVYPYRVDQCAADIRDLIRALGRERAVIIAHDWGGAIAWRVAMDYPDLVERLVVMNAPHPVAFAREWRNGWAQRLRSWYMFFFRLPWLPETLLATSPLATARLFFRKTVVRPNAFSEADLDVMAVALAQPGAMRAMINWYRAAFRHPPQNRTQVIQAPTLLIWGEDDPALGKALTYGLEKWLPLLDIHYIPGCGHWVQNEAADEVNARLLDWLAG